MFAQFLAITIQGVIFDVDGTLVDSNDAHAHAWMEALAESGRDVPLARIRPLIGMGGDKLLREAASVSAESTEGQAIGARRGEIFRSKYLPRPPRSPAKPGRVAARAYLGIE